MRRFLTLLRVVSLLLGACVGAFWVRSYWIEVEVRSAGPQGFWSLEVSRGILFYYRECAASSAQDFQEHSILNPFGVGWTSRSPPSERGDPIAAYGRVANGHSFGVGNFKVASHDGSSEPFPVYVSFASVPCWVLTAALLLPVLAWVVIRR